MAAMGIFTLGLFVAIVVALVTVIHDHENAQQPSASPAVACYVTLDTPGNDCSDGLFGEQVAGPFSQPTYQVATSDSFWAIGPHRVVHESAATFWPGSLGENFEEWFTVVGDHAVGVITDATRGGTWSHWAVILTESRASGGQVTVLSMDVVQPPGVAGDDAVTMRAVSNRVVQLTSSGGTVSYLSVSPVGFVARP